MGGRRENNQGKMSRGKKFTFIFLEIFKKLNEKINEAAYGIDEESFIY